MVHIRARGSCTGMVAKSADLLYCGYDVAQKVKSRADHRDLYGGVGNADVQENLGLGGVRFCEIRNHAFLLPLNEGHSSSHARLAPRNSSR